MNGVIFGSGIIGLIAKRILSGNWTVVPFGKSRFYSFNPALADNFIVRDADIDQCVRDVVGSQVPVFFYKRCFSAAGQLTKEFDAAICTAWLSKIFGNNIPSQSLPYLEKRMTSSIYGVRTNVLYNALMADYKAMLVADAAKGPVTEIGKNYFIRGGVRTEFDAAISTIPLPALCDLIGAQHNLATKPEYYVVVKSDAIDLEGCNQAFVVDGNLSFYRVTNISKGVYTFYFITDEPNPGAYLLPIIGAADVVDGTSIADAIPIGNIPDLTWLSEYGIYPIGSYAQHDWCADVGSNILKLVRYAQRGFKP